MQVTGCISTVVPGLLLFRVSLRALAFSLSSLFDPGAMAGKGPQGRAGFELRTVLYRKHLTVLYTM